jgi:cell division protein FtsB
MGRDIMSKDDEIKALKAENKALKEESKKQAATIKALKATVKKLKHKVSKLNQLWFYTGVDLNESAEKELNYTKGRREHNVKKSQLSAEIAKCRPEYLKRVKDLMNGDPPLIEKHAKSNARDYVADLVEERTGWRPDDGTISKRFPAKEKLDLSGIE